MSAIYEVHRRGDGISSSVWDRSHPDLMWCVGEIGPEDFALGNTVALFVKEEDARLFAAAANARTERTPAQQGEPR